ncbi:uncharacterized protein PITG_01987 [Phytophthora infestans T30-4]|uniref:Uncharacterized protein n=1 Tax=Phytophthora infestans (strain T30-4) TaxID=403677 RepID=D0MUK8_PHYIT|nr:uncharacterized protein PITG_01987 [Phytophthora infestans T30-4]EEY61655.1 conserved hypothetical protein [Phytophthora infestans T30-4]|eukprot:XP_002908572.1 conserved hypothetical protein [Phytophthora infestans T30-4]
MKKFYGRSLGLRTLCETRWNSMQGCFASLLRVQSALEMLYRHDLKIAEAVISPLSYASYRLQRDENTVGDVVLSYRDIFKGFSRHGDELVKCVEERWRECEQPLFMLGFALHPTYADEARTLPNTSISGVEDVGVLRSDMFAWMQRKFTRTRPSEFKGSVSEYWTYVAVQKPEKTF